MENAKNTYQAVETEIDLIQLLVELLRKIKPVILCALICGVLFGGWKAFDGMRDMKRQQAQPASATDAAERTETDPDEAAMRQYEKSVELYEAQKTAYQAQLDRTLEEIAAKEEYRRNSVLLNIDPQNLYQKTAVWYVDTHYQINPGAVMQDPNPLNDIMSAYDALLASGEFYGYVQKQISETIDARYIGELIFTSTDSGSALLQVTVLGSSEQMAKELLAATKQYIELNYSKISVAVGNYDIAIVQDVDIGNGAGTKDSMDAVIGAQTAYNSQMTALQNTVTDLNIKILSLVEPEEPKAKPEEKAEDSNAIAPLSSSAVIRSGAKRGIIGLLLGAVLAGLYIAISFIAKDPAVSEDELRKRYGVFVLASVKRFPGKGAWQKMLAKLSGDTKRSTDMEEAVGLAQANVISILEASGQKEGKVLLVGMDTVALSEVERLTTGKQSGCITAGGDIMTDKNAVEMLRGYENVVLVERKGALSYREIGRELEKLALLNKNVVGMIAL